VLLSSLITRRAIQRRIQWAKPTFFRQNDQHPEQKVDGGLEAIKAFGMATVNVFSWSIMFTGGVLWATNTSGLEEIRARLKVGLGLTEAERKDSQEIVGEWIKAAKPWNAWKSEEKSNSDPKPDRTTK
jgi:hypothetical protein